MTDQIIQGGTTSGNILPTVTGQNLGSDAQRWDVYAQILDAAGAFSARYLNDIVFAEGLPGADIGAQIMAAMADLPTSGGYAQGTIVLPRGTGTWSTPVEITSPFVNIIGLGSGVSSFTSNIDGPTLYVHGDPFTSGVQANILSGFALSGTGTTNGAGIKFGDLIGLSIRDILLENFSGSSGVGLWGDCETDWVERLNINRVWIYNSKTGFQLTNTTGSRSFAYSRILDLSINVGNNQTAISISDDVQFDRSVLFATVNVTGTGTVLNLDETASMNEVLFHLVGENSSVGGAGIVTGGTTTVRAFGLIAIGDNLTNTISGTWSGIYPINFDDTNPVQLWMDNGSGLSLIRGTVDLRLSDAAAAGQAGTESAHPLNLRTNATNRWQVTSGGHLLAVTDNTYDIGASGATRPKDIFASGVVTAGGQITGATLRVTGATPTVSASQIGIGDSTQSTVGAAGAASALPGNPAGYLLINIAGTNFAVPYWAAS